MGLAIDAGGGLFGLLNERPCPGDLAELARLMSQDEEEASSAASAR
ncbi:hypothetical protein [Actinomadura nitritigenes]